MVDIPEITPQVAGRRGSARDVPTLRDVKLPNIPSVGMVAPTGFEQLSRSLGTSAAMLERQGQMFQVEAKNIASQIRDKQRIEAEKKYLEAEAQAQIAIENAKLSHSKEDGPFAAIADKIYNEVAGDALSSKGLSGFQQEVLSRKFTLGRARQGVANTKFQIEFDELSAALELEQSIEMRANKLLSNPSLWFQEIEDQTDYINGLENVSELKKKELLDKMQERFTMSAGVGLIEQRPEKALEIFSSEDFTKYVDPTQLLQLRELAETEVKARKQEAKKEEAELKSAVALTLTQSAARGDLSIDTLINESTEAKLEASEFRAILSVMTQDKTGADAGNPALANEIGLEILKDKIDGKIFDPSKLLKAVNPETNAGRPILNTTQLEHLMKLQDAGEANILKGAFETIKAGFSTKTPMGALTQSVHQERREQQARIELMEEIEKAREKGIPASELVNPKSQYYIVDGIIKRNKATPSEARNEMLDVMRGASDDGKKRLPNESVYDWKERTNGIK